MSANTKNSGKLNGKETEDHVVGNDIKAVNSEEKQTELIMKESRTINQSVTDN